MSKLLTDVRQQQADLRRLGTRVRKKEYLAAAGEGSNREADTVLAGVIT
jgi:hypothetical protein